MRGCYRFVSAIFNEGACLSFTLIFHKALKDGIIVICYFRKKSVFLF